MNTHAYLIMAHNEPKALDLLLNVLDDPRNHIYIHIDLSCGSIDKHKLPEKCKRAKVTLIKSENVYWSGYSQVDVTLRLLKTAVQNNHRYYHLISGVDLPLKSQDAIHEFFQAHDGEEFVSYGEVNTWKISSRYKYYHFEKLSEYGRTKYRIFRLISDIIQRILFIDLSKKTDMKFHMGGQWFSITHDFATYVLENEPLIFKTFKYGFCIDEIFLPTLLMNSPFKENVSPKMNLRYVDWTRGNPYVWQLKDYDELMNNNLMFARKFSYEGHPEIMEKIKADILGK